MQECSKVKPRRRSPGKQMARLGKKPTAPIAERQACRDSTHARNPGAENSSVRILDRTGRGKLDVIIAQKKRKRGREKKGALVPKRSLGQVTCTHKSRKPQFGIEPVNLLSTRCKEEGVAKEKQKKKKRGGGREGERVSGMKSCSTTRLRISNSLLKVRAP